MLRLLVSPQVHFSLETFPAEVTAERFESRVFPAVCDEIGALTEGLPAHLALVRLLTCSRNKMTQLEMLALHALRTVRRSRVARFVSDDRCLFSLCGV